MYVPLVIYFDDNENEYPPSSREAGCSLGENEALRLNFEESATVAAALADRSRLRILGALLAGPKCVEELAAQLGLASSTISFHLKKLRLARLVAVTREQYYTVYTLIPESLRLTVRDLVAADDPLMICQTKSVVTERRKTLAAYLVNGRLQKMPVQRRKRTIILEEFAALFTPGVRYPEQSVDKMIRTTCDDHCLVRRLLIDEGYLQRTQGVYERTSRPLGRPVDPSGAERMRGVAVNANMSGNATPDMELDKNQDTDSNTHRSSRAYRAAARRAYGERKKQAGVFRVLNTANGRVLLGSALDLHAPLNRVTFELDMAMCWNPEMKRDLETFGRDSFVIEILEKVQSQDDTDFDPEQELQMLERKHLASLDWSTSYNKDSRIRYP